MTGHNEMLNYCTIVFSERWLGSVVLMVSVHNQLRSRDQREKTIVHQPCSEKWREALQRC